MGLCRTPLAMSSPKKRRDADRDTDAFHHRLETQIQGLKLRSAGRVDPVESDSHRRISRGLAVGSQPIPPGTGQRLRMDEDLARQVPRLLGLRLASREEAKRDRRKT